MSAAETSFRREHIPEQPPDPARDPVCGMTVDTRTAHRAEHAGADYFFCSAGCRDKFTAEPARYLAAPRGETPNVAAPKTGEVLWTCPMHPQIVRLIFRRYAELGSVRLLNEELAARGIKSKSWTSASGRRIGGKPFSRGALYLIVFQRRTGTPLGNETTC